MKNKTLVISSFHPLISRNILHTDVFKLLCESLDIIVLCPDYKENYFKSSFEGNNIKIIGVKFSRLSRLERIWKEIGNSLLRTSTIKNNRYERYLVSRDFIGFLFFKLVQQIFARIKSLKKVYQIISPYVFKSQLYKKILNEYKPDMVFSTDIFHDEDVRLLSSSKLVKINTIGMVRSWDNCTNKGILPVIPQNIFVHNKNILNELKSFHYVDNNEIIITGIPQFDYYYKYKPVDESFFIKTGFDKNRKIILFAPTGLKFVDDDWYILNILLEAVSRKEIVGDPQVLVRFPPGDQMDLNKVIIPSNVNIYIDKPGKSFNEERIKDRELTKSDMVLLADTLYWSSVLISVGSTLCIDISAFNKPVIMPSLKVEGVDFHRSMRKMYTKYHYRYLIDSKSCYYPKTVTNFIADINKSLTNPQDNRSFRYNLLIDQAGFFDGKSCDRLTQKIIQIINK